MKISHRTHPILAMLETDNPIYYFNPNVPEPHNIVQMFDKGWKRYRSLFKKNIDIITQPFSDAIQLAIPKMQDAGLYKTLPSEMHGTLIYRDIVSCYSCKRININGVGATLISLVHMEHKNTIVCFSFETERYVDSEVIKAFKNWPFETIVKNLWYFPQAALMFKQYAQVETKYLAPGQKIKGIDCNYKNETKSPIIILDSTWFTNLVKSDAFKVRGHFRLQPKKKDGEWTKELIWISDFMKTGYTSPARKTKEDVL